jgi:hypothetical protein
VEGHNGESRRPRYAAFSSSHHDRVWSHGELDNRLVRDIGVMRMEAVRRLTHADCDAPQSSGTRQECK